MIVQIYTGIIKINVAIPIIKSLKTFKRYALVILLVLDYLKEIMPNPKIPIPQVIYFIWLLIVQNLDEKNNISKNKNVYLWHSY